MDLLSDGLLLLLGVDLLSDGLGVWNSLLGKNSSLDLGILIPNSLSNFAPEMTSNSCLSAPIERLWFWMSPFLSTPPAISTDSILRAKRYGSEEFLSKIIVCISPPINWFEICLNFRFLMTLEKLLRTSIVTESLPFLPSTAEGILLRSSKDWLKLISLKYEIVKTSLALDPFKRLPAPLRTIGAKSSDVDEKFSMSIMEGPGALIRSKPSIVLFSFSESVFNLMLDVFLLSGETIIAWFMSV